MAAFAIVLGYLEHLIPLPIGIYGIKLGLANLAILSLLYLTDIKSALAVHLLRIAICGILFGNMFSFIYSLAGGLFSFLVMALLKRWDRLSPVGVSICGGVAHNMAQLIAAVCLVDQLKLAFYLPVLLLAGTLAGFAVGSCSLAVIQTMKKKKP
ncbi:MAG: Gx transporter family protein [Ruminococcaceae bacterium]|nr:Gx transporter family protein [Oscillospiraceae bacterium]